MIECLLFDLDGTLFDSRAANIASYSQAFQEVGIAFDSAKYESLFGLRFDEAIQAIAPDSTPDQRLNIQELKSKYYKENIDLITPNSGLIELLISTRSQFKSALVTTARRKNVNSLLEHFLGGGDLFNLIIAGEDVSKGKPDPECYLLAVERLNTKASKCLIFEDSQVGIEAAGSAGIKYVRVAI